MLMFAIKTVNRHVRLRAARGWSVPEPAGGSSFAQREQFVDAGHVQVGLALRRQVLVRLGTPEPGGHRDRERPPPVRHRHLELRIVTDHDQVREWYPESAAGR